MELCGVINVYRWMAKMISARFRFDCYEDGYGDDNIDVNLHSVIVTIHADTYNELIGSKFQSHMHDFEWNMKQKYNGKKLKFGYHIEGGVDWEKMIITKRMKKIG